MPIDFPGLVSRFTAPVRWGPNEPLDHNKLNAMMRGVVRRVTVGPGLTKIESPDGSAVAIALAARHHPGSRLFPVSVSNPIGDEGGFDGDCTWAYDVRDLGVTTGDPLLTEAAPVYPRDPRRKYTAGTIGLAYYDQTDTLKLWTVNEQPESVLVTKVTAFRVDETTNKLQMKTRSEYALSADAESDWIDVHTGTVCP